MTDQIDKALNAYDKASDAREVLAEYINELREEVERLRLQLRWTRKMGAALLGKPLDIAEIEKIEAELARPVFHISAPDHSAAIAHADQRITQLQQEVERLRGTGWQPIETAPKTIKSRLVWCPENKCTFCVTWNQLSNRWEVFGGSYRTFLDRVTHWMPMPYPPKEDGHG